MIDGDKQDSEPERQERTFSFLQRYFFDAGYVFFTAWIRRIVQTNYGSYRVFLGSRYHFLLYFRMFLAIVYLLFQTFKT